MVRLSYQSPEGAMAPQGEAGFPATLSTWVREIVQGCSTLWNAEEVEEAIEAADGGAEAVLGE